MPTYDYQCLICGAMTSRFQTIHEYLQAPQRPVCDYHGVMERRLSVNPAMSGLANALAGDRHYDGLTAQDGADISTRTKHRQYMKEHDLAMYSDFKQTWADAAKEREKIRQGQDAERKQLLREEVMKVVAQPD